MILRHLSAHMTKTILCSLILLYLFYGCAPSNHSDSSGGYYLCYMNGKMMSEDDSSSQVYIHLYSDGTYIIKDTKRIERGTWKTIDYDILITYFYPSYMNSFFRIGAVGETMMGSPPHDPNTTIFRGLNWHGAGILSDDSFDQILFCQQGKVLTEDDIREVLAMDNGHNPKDYHINK